MQNSLSRELKSIAKQHLERERRITALEKQMKLIGRKLKLDFNKLNGKEIR